MMNKLILGTAAFGSDYGIKHDGQPSIYEIEKIARIAWDAGIRVIHTSWQYGLPKIVNAIFDEFEWIEKVEHDPTLFCWQGQFGKSLYEPIPLTGDLPIAFQVPVNILDHRFLNWIHGAKEKVCEIHARSVFLQGLLLMDRLPAWIVSGPAVFQIGNFRTQAFNHGLESYEAALGWVLGLDDIDRVIVGVNSPEQLEQLVKVKPLKWDYDFSIQDEMVLDPRRWPLAETNKCIKDEDLKRNVESSTAIEGVHLKL